ncbi:MAG: glycyl-radical enzyme activating protein [Anaerolineae bacterium]|jgi:pyruvate formate lyase activating enzyme|nr:MAG: glycyl-radical enzyme activating protein [Anaerolineae bacterium]
MSPLTARILHLQRFSTEDGPGIRTTVFFKGCPLRCAWCHNPESMSPNPQLQWLETRCIGCNTCIQTCPQGNLRRAPNGSLHIARDDCLACGKCVDACPANALEMLGHTVSLEDLLAEVLKDRSYYETSGGGITASGGEPGLQADFVAEFFRRLKQEHLSTAFDTCGLIASAAFEKILPYTDWLLYDLKEIDEEKHRRFTSQGNQRILQNLLQIGEWMNDFPTLHLWIRTPLIPGATARTDNLLGIGDFLIKNLNGKVERWELCAFNNLCRDKYRRLGMDWDYQHTPLLTAEELTTLTEAARVSGFPPDLIIPTGATRVQVLETEGETL